jgi:hypothetical protein
MKVLIGLFFLDKPIPAVQLAFLQRRCKSDRGLTFGELEQFIEANPAKWQKTDVRY